MAEPTQSSSLREQLVSYLAFALFLAATKVWEDVQTNSWQHSGLRLHLLEGQEWLARAVHDLQETACFRAAVRQTLDRLDTFEPALDTLDPDIEQEATS